MYFNNFFGVFDTSTERYDDKLGMKVVLTLAVDGLCQGADASQLGTEE